jgi:hypothetical protein
LAESAYASPKLNYPACYVTMYPEHQSHEGFEKCRCTEEAFVAFLFPEKEKCVTNSFFIQAVRSACIVIIVTVFSGSAFATIPLVTDDTATEGKGKFQLELFGEYATGKEEDVTNKNSDLTATLTYGLSDPVDISLSIPYQVLGTDDSALETRGSGFSDPAIEVKWRFYEKEGLSLALKPGVTIPAGNDKKELGAGKVTYYLFFIASKEMNPWTFHINLAYIRNSNWEDERKDIWHASFASMVDMTKKLKLAADVGIESNPERSSANPRTYILCGIIYSPIENIDLGLGLKGGLTKPEPDVAIRGGITYSF